MLIPKGSTVVIGATAIDMNDKLYSDPDTFNPDRFLGYTKISQRLCG